MDSTSDKTTNVEGNGEDANPSSGVDVNAIQSNILTEFDVRGKVSDDGDGSVVDNDEEILL